jgi:hypothetical protein
VSLQLAIAQLEAELPDDAKLALQRESAGHWHATVYQWRSVGPDLHLTASGDTLAAAVAALADA